MSKLNDNSITIYEALQNIENGRYVMPAFQRQYVWSMEQIEKLWDYETGEEIDSVSPGVKGQKVFMKLPIKCENNWILRRKK